MRPDRFGRLFPNLEPFAEPKPKIVAALKALGAQGGIMDVGDDLAAGPLGLILNPGANRDNPAHTAGMTFVGQFIDHDLTLDATSPLGVETDPGRTVNGRSPAFDLDSVYGSGPFGDPILYEADKLRLRVGARGAFEDVPRMPDGTPLIGDARNDENVAVNGLHAAFLKFHNRVLETGAAANFKQARKLVTWHWQWIVLNEFLPADHRRRRDRRAARRPQAVQEVPGPVHPGRVPGRVVSLRPLAGAPVLPDELHRRGRRRPALRVRLRRDADHHARPDRHAGRDAPAPAATSAGRRSSASRTRRGRRSPARTRRSTRTSPRRCSTCRRRRSAAPRTCCRWPQRNLLRHLTWSIPSGQKIAKKVGAPVLSADDLADLGPIHKDFPKSTPLWFYTLREADKFHDGARLGPVGGLLVGGVIVGLMQRDPNCYLNAAPGWKPSLGSTPGVFNMTDLLDYAGVGGIR